MVVCTKSTPPAKRWYAQALKRHIADSPLKRYWKTVNCIIRTATAEGVICHSEEKLYFDEESLFQSCVQCKDSSLTLFVQNDSGLCPLPEVKAFSHWHRLWLSVRNQCHQPSRWYAQALKGHIADSPFRRYWKTVICIIPTATTKVVICHSEQV